MKNRIIFTREEMLKENISKLKSRGVEVDDIAKITFRQQSKYTPDIPYALCVESVEKILSLRDIFHAVQLGIEIDRLTEKKAFEGPIQDILEQDLGLFGLDEVVGIEIAGIYGTIGETNFGDIDVNKIGIVKELNDLGKDMKSCHTFLDDIVGAVAAAASTRVAQVLSEESASLNPNIVKSSLFDL
ncbi:MAG: phosphatidylglycerophosphatase A [Acholeplasmatales bacterium]|jgi:phosphatidylglycerophosphatase A|nr:phosphatidylglycerophosphatase A [Acholeplasmatales bacterium]